MELPNSKPVCQVGSVQLLFDSTGQQGISAAVHEVSGVIDSLNLIRLPTLRQQYRYGSLLFIQMVLRIDHLVVTTADCDRTTRTFESNGIHPVG